MLFCKDSADGFEKKEVFVLASRDKCLSKGVGAVL